MPVPIKNENAIYQDIKQRMSAYFGSEFTNQSYVNMEATAIAFYFGGIYKSIKWIGDNSFLSTAFDDDAIKKLCFERANGMVQKGSVGSFGAMNISGSVGTVIPNGTIFNSAEGLIFQTVGDGLIEAQSLNITNIIRVGNVVTVTTAVALNLSSNNLVTISGVLPADFNVVNTQIKVTDANKFTYELAGTQGTGAGVGVITYNIASVVINANSSGVATNLSQGAELTIQTPIANLDNIGYVGFQGLIGGAEAESIEELRQRGLKEIRNPQILFSAKYYQSLAIDLEGVSRAWCIPPQNEDMIGKITIYILPATVNNIENLKAKILDGSYSPIIQEADIVVQAPTVTPITVTVTSLTPNTATMKTAVQNSLISYFETLDMGQDGNIEDIKTIISLTQDSSGNFAKYSSVSTGSLLTAFDELLTYQATIFN